MTYWRGPMSGAGAVLPAVLPTVLPMRKFLRSRVVLLRSMPNCRVEGGRVVR